jgi:hypothetical protein
MLPVVQELQREILSPLSESDQANLIELIRQIVLPSDASL